MPHFFKNFPITGYQFKDNNTNQIVVDIFRHVKAGVTVDDAAAYAYYDIQDGERPDNVSYNLYETTQYYWTFFLLNEHLRDGLHNWPKEYNELQTYIKEKYPNKVITSYMSAEYALTSRNGGIGHYVYPKFSVGETITGNVTFHTATIKEIRSPLNQIIIENATGDFAQDTEIRGTTDGHTLLRNASYDFSVEDEYNATHHYEDVNGNEVPRTLFSKGETDLTEITNREYEEALNEANAQIKVLKKPLVQDFARAYKKLINR